MRTYERNAVVVEQCTGCGGLFLDRGELERLVAAENLWHQQSVPSAPVATPAPAPAAPQDYRQDHHRQDHHRQDHRPQYGQPDYRQQGYRPKKKSFLSELFDD